MRKFLLECKKAYYEGNPIISDSQYDAMEEVCKTPIGANAGRVKHLFKMYSLNKVYDESELNNKFPFNTEMHCTPKLDGAAISLRYVMGNLDMVLSRGDGEYGENITHLFKTIHEETGIPQTIPNNGIVQITGEIVSPKRISNARNYAAGALNLKDPEKFFDKEIEFFAYDYQVTPFETYLAVLWHLRDIGFSTLATHSSDHLPKDGNVYRVMSNKLYKEMGFTSKFPRGACAVKERSEGVRTIIKDVIWQTGKSGKVTPVAILEPINIDGATISRATLNNPGFIEALGVDIGDAVMVERAGGIIPRIIKKAE